MYCIRGLPGQQERKITGKVEAHRHRLELSYPVLGKLQLAFRTVCLATQGHQGIDQDLSYICYCPFNSDT